MDINLNDFIRPELFVLIPALMIIGKIIKSSFINDKHIPLILGAISIVLSSLYLFLMEREPLSHAALMGFIQGVLISGISVYGNQIFKQYTKKDE